MQQPTAAAALSSLHLGSCGLTDGGVGAIARALRCGACQARSGYRSRQPNCARSGASRH